MKTSHTRLQVNLLINAHKVEGDVDQVATPQLILGTDLDAGRADVGQPEAQAAACVTTDKIGDSRADRHADAYCISALRPAPGPSDFQPQVGYAASRPAMNLDRGGIQRITRRPRQLERLTVGDRDEAPIAIGRPGHRQPAPALVVFEASREPLNLVCPDPEFKALTDRQQLRYLRHRRPHPVS